MRCQGRWVCLLLCIAVLLPAAGCKKKRAGPTDVETVGDVPVARATSSTPKPVTKPATQPATERDPNAGLSGLARVWNEQEVKNNLKNLAIAYHHYFTETNKGPTKASDLAPYYGKVPQITEALDKGWIVFFYKVTPFQMREGTSNTILAYERDPDALGMRWIVKGDGSVEKVSAQEFEKMPKAGK